MEFMTWIIWLIIIIAHRLAFNGMASLYHRQSNYRTLTSVPCQYFSMSFEPSYISPAQNIQTTGISQITALLNTHITQGVQSMKMHSNVWDAETVNFTLTADFSCLRVWELCDFSCFSNIDFYGGFQLPSNIAFVCESPPELHSQQNKFKAT